MSYNRKKTREVSLGNIKIGGNNPIAVQSMTTTDTRDAIKTIEQIKIRRSRMRRGKGCSS